MPIVDRRAPVPGGCVPGRLRWRDSIYREVSGSVWAVEAAADKRRGHARSSNRPWKGLIQPSCFLGLSGSSLLAGNETVFLPRRDSGFEPLSTTIGFGSVIGSRLG